MSLESIALRSTWMALLWLLASAGLPSVSRAQKTPVFVLRPQVSTIRFFVRSSIDLEGTFEKWEATLTFTSPDVSTGILNIDIQAATVNTGSDLKDDKLKSKDFFDVKQDPLIKFRSNKMMPTGPNTFSVAGTFTI
jgi:polyisoprenoid-binding protein YceI